MHLGTHVGRKRCATVEHGQHDADEMKGGVEPISDEIDRGHQLAEAFERVVLALDRNEDAVRRREGIHGEQPERRRAIEQNVVVFINDGGQGLSETPFAIRASGPARPPLRRGSGDDGTIQRPSMRVGWIEVCMRDRTDERVVDRPMHGTLCQGRRHSWRCPGDRGRRSGLGGHPEPDRTQG